MITYKLGSWYHARLQIAGHTFYGESDTRKWAMDIALMKAYKEGLIR